MSVIESTTTQIAPAGTWVADPAHSSVAFEVVHSGISTFRGGFADYDATLVGGSAHSPHLSAAGTLVDPENTIVLPAQPAKPWGA